MLKELIKQLKAKDAALKALLDGPASAEAMAQMKELSGEVLTLNEQIEAAKAAEASRAKSAELVTVGDDEPAGIGHNSGAKDVEIIWPIEKLEKGQRSLLGIAAAFKSVAQKKSVPQILEEDGGTRLVKEVFGTTNTKLLNTGTNSAGGFTVPTNLSNDLIELLYPETVFLQGGPRRLPMPNGKIEIPGALAGASAGWVGEGGAKPYSEATFRKIDLKAKKLAAITGLTWEMINYTVFDIVQFAGADLRQAIATGLDTGLLMGAGTGNIPLGILKIGTVGTRAATNAVAPTAAQIDADASKVSIAMYNANLRNMAGWRWLMTLRTATYLADLRDANSNPIYPQMQGPNRTFKGIPVMITPAIPNNLGAGTNESTIALVDFNQVIWGSSMDLTTKASDVAAVDMGAGLVSAWQNNLVFLLAEMTADVEIRFDSAVQLLTAVKWGA